MFGRIIEITREEIQAQYNDTIATVNRGQCIAIQSCIFQETRLVCFRQTPTHRIAFTDRSSDRIIRQLPYVDMYIMDTIVAVHCLFSIDIISGSRDIIQSTPSIRNLVCTDIEGIICDVIGLMNEEM